MSQKWNFVNIYLTLLTGNNESFGLFNVVTSQPIRLSDNPGAFITAAISVLGFT